MLNISAAWKLPHQSVTLEPMQHGRCSALVHHPVTGCCLANQCSHSAALHSACSHATATALPSNAAWTLLSARATRGVAWPIIAATVLPGLLSAASLLHSHPITAQPVELCSVTVALLPSSILPSVSAQCQSLRTTELLLYPPIQPPPMAFRTCPTASITHSIHMCRSPADASRHTLNVQQPPDQQDY